MKISSFFLIILAAAVLMAFLIAQAPAPPVDEIPAPTEPAAESVPTTPAAGWYERDGQRFYLDMDGTPLTGWHTVEDKRYYFRADGAMARGRVEIDGVSRFFTADGSEILVANPWNPVPAGYAPELVALDTYYGSAGMQVDPVCLADLTAMIDACNASGSRAYVLSAYRSFEQQTELYNGKVARLMAAGASRTDAEAEAATVVLLPGTSEHHLGLAVDIIDTRLWALDERQAELPGQQWLMENSWRYGFILRYPEGKTAVTGVIYEPWHYRYVGKDLAAELYGRGLTLEEYLNSLN